MRRARPHSASKTLSMGQIFEIRRDHRLHDIQIQVAVLMHRNIAKAHHPLQPLAKLAGNDLLPGKYGEGLPALCGNSEAPPPYQHVGQIDRRIADTDHVEKGGILQVVVGAEVSACLCSCLAGARHTPLQRRDPLGNNLVHGW